MERSPSAKHTYGIMFMQNVLVWDLETIPDLGLIAEAQKINDIKSSRTF